MTGYLGDQIQEYFGDGKKLGVQIQYSQGTAEWDTGRRLHQADRCCTACTSWPHRSPTPPASAVCTCRPS